MGIYNTPTIYKNGGNIGSSSWVNITDKLGTFATGPQSGIFRIFYNKQSKLVSIYTYGGFASSSQNERKIFDFKNDVPNNLFSLDVLVCLYGGNIGFITISTADKKASIQNVGISYSQWVSCYQFFLISDSTAEILEQYLEQ